MDLQQFATAVYNICILSVVIFFIAIPIGKGMAGVFGTRTPLQVARNVVPGKTPKYFQNIAALLVGIGSALRDVAYEKYSLPQSDPWQVFYSPRNPDRLIVWIHGTWRKAHHSAHQPLLESLKAQFPDAHIVAFNWRARNSEEDRRAANSALAQRIRSTEFGLLPIRLIGHSHGGTIAATTAAGLPESRDIKAITLGTPFVTVDLTSPSGGSIRARHSTQSAFILFHLWSVAVGLFVTGVLLSSGFRLLPRIDGLFTQAASDALSAILIGIICGLGLAAIRNMRLNRRIGVARRKVAELLEGQIVKSKVIGLRADDDPLLDLLATKDTLHEHSVAARVLADRVTNNAYRGTPDAIKDYIFKVGVFVVFLLLIQPVYLRLGRFALSLPTEAYVLATLVLIAVTLLGVAAAFFWRFPLRLFVSLGSLFGRFLVAMSPPNLLLIHAQARAAGVPLDTLIAGAVRFEDAPNGSAVIPIETNGSMATVSPIERHTEMLRLPQVIQRVSREI